VNALRPVSEAVAPEAKSNERASDSGDTSDGDDSPAETQEQHLAAILAAADERADRQRTTWPGERRNVRKLLIHVHGGLNSESHSLGNADRNLARILDETDAEDWHYPIFVTWSSGLFGAYGEYLFVLRNGRHAPWLGAFTWPVYLASDLAQGIAKTPRSWLTQSASDLHLALRVGFDGTLLPTWINADRAYEHLAEDPSPFAGVRMGDYRRGWLRQSGRFLLYWTTLLPSLGISAVGLESMGPGAWEGMLHRSAELFYHHDQFDISSIEPGPESLRAEFTKPPQGVFAVFLRQLIAHMAAERAADPTVRYELTLVGHSMGAIILNDALRQYIDPQSWGDGDAEALPIRHIVYMAPACSVGEAATAVVPFLETHEQAWFHLLTLHPQAELDELNTLGVVPRGSLLEWIDTFFTRPTGPLERRLGKWINVMQGLDVFRRIADRMTIKAFGVDGGSSKPQQHGDFNQCPFWKREFWSPAGPMNYYDD
jgi:hypothetical protein